MHKLHPEALAKAQAFLKTSHALSLLGYGVSGFVFAAPHMRTAVKVHHTSDAYRTELKSYRLLNQHKFTSLHGLTIPKMLRHDDEKCLIEMDLVTPPFLLDFAGAKFEDPQFSADTMADIHSMIAERFGSNAHIAYAVHASLRKIGMHYLDLRSSNLNIKGLPGINVDEDIDFDQL